MEKTANTVAGNVAGVASVADPLEVTADFYFDVLQTGLYWWIQEEQRHASTPARDSGLSEPQRYVLELALQLIRKRARSHQRAVVFATSAQVQLLLERAGRSARPKDVFLGWKHRIGAGDGSRPFQAVPLNDVDEYLVILDIRGGSGRREIRAYVARAVKQENHRIIRLLAPKSGDAEILLPITTELQPDSDPATRSAAQTLYELFKRDDAAAAKKFLEFCDTERIAIVAALQQLLRLKKRTILGSAVGATLIQIGNTVTVANTPGSDPNEPAESLDRDPAAVSRGDQLVRDAADVLERQERERAERRRAAHHQAEEDSDSGDG